MQWNEILLGVVADDSIDLEPIMLLKLLMLMTIYFLLPITFPTYYNAYDNIVFVTILSSFYFFAFLRLLST